MDLTVYTTDSYFDHTINLSYRAIIATLNKEKAKEIMFYDSELHISQNPEDIEATIKEPHTVFTVCNIFPTIYRRINPFQTNFYNGIKGRIYIEITEWPQKCSVKNCDIPSKTVCIKYDIISKKTGKPQISYVCPSCAQSYLFNMVDSNFQNLINALFFRTYFEKCVLSDNDSNKDLLLDIFKED